MRVQEYLLNRSLDQLKSDHGVRSRIHGHKVSLNYCMIESVDTDPLAQECRGLILSPGGPVRESEPLGSTVVLARSFDRFFNLGQSAAAPVDLNDPRTRFYEKLDGTLAIVYFDRVVDEWHVATRSVPEADVRIDDLSGHTFRSLFEVACLKTTGRGFSHWTESLDRSVTYMFELTTPINRIVVEYSEYGITLLGARVTNTGDEIDPHGPQGSAVVGTPAAPMHTLGTLQDAVEFVANRDPSAHEGVVACDSQWRRVKIKNAGYLALSRVKEKATSSPRSLIEVFLMGKLDDAMPLLPDHVREHARQVAPAFARLSDQHEAAFAAASEAAEGHSDPREHRKAFAIAVKQSGVWMAPLMSRYQGQCMDLVGWIMKTCHVDGSWPTATLDTVVNELRRVGWGADTI